MAQLASGSLMSGISIFDLLPRSLGPQTTQKKQGHQPPKFWIWMKFVIKTSPSLNRWPSWPPDDLFRVFWYLTLCLEVSDPTGLQSSDFGWNLQSKHHHHFIDGPVDLRMTYVRYFDIIPIAWKSQTPNPLKNRGHRPPKFWFWMKFAIKTSPSLHRWPSWPPDDLCQVFWYLTFCLEVSHPKPPKKWGHRPPKFWFWMKFAIKTSPSMKWWWCFNWKFFPKSKLWRPAALFFGGVGVQAFQARFHTSKYRT